MEGECVIGVDINRNLFMVVLFAWAAAIFNIKNPVADSARWLGGFSIKCVLFVCLVRRLL